MTKKPLHTRDPLGRHKVDLRNIRSPWLRYGLALAVVALVVGAAALSWQDDPLVEEDVAWLVPWIGWGAIGFVGVALGLRFIGRRR